MEERDPWSAPPPSDLDEEREEGGFSSRVIPDLFRRALMTGIGSVFMTEESIRNTLSDLKMPKEAMNYVVNQADRTKRELIATLARELRSFLDNLELDQLVKNSLEDTTLEIHTKITIKKGEDGEPKLEVGDRKTSVTKAAKEAAEEHDEDEGQDDDEGESAAQKKASSRSSSTRKKTTTRKKNSSSAASRSSSSRSSSRKSPADDEEEDEAED